MAEPNYDKMPWLKALRERENKARAARADLAPAGTFEKAPKGSLADRDYTGTHLDAQKMLELVNAYRSSKGVQPLKLDPRLTDAAKAHSKDLAKWDRISHYGSDGSDPWDRVKRTDYNARLAAENVGTGQASMEEVFSGWQESEGHNRNLLLPDATVMGLALVQDPKTEFKTFWTMVLGAPLAGKGPDPNITDAKAYEQLKGINTKNLAGMGTAQRQIDYPRFYLEAARKEAILKKDAKFLANTYATLDRWAAYDHFTHNYKNGGADVNKESAISFVQSMLNKNNHASSADLTMFNEPGKGKTSAKIAQDSGLVHALTGVQSVYVDGVGEVSRKDVFKKLNLGPDPEAAPVPKAKKQAGLEDHHQHAGLGRPESRNDSSLRLATAGDVPSKIENPVQSAAVDPPAKKSPPAASMNA